MDPFEVLDFLWKQEGPIYDPEESFYLTQEARCLTMDPLQVFNLLKYSSG